MLRPDYPIGTERLLLRPLQPSDLDDLHAYYSRADVCRFIPPQPRTREQLAERFDDPERNRTFLDDEGQALQLGVQLRDGGRLIGDVILFWHNRVHRLGELGYVFNPEFHGHGYATEAGAAMLALAFDRLGLHRVSARIDARNDASANVLRRLGMRQEAHLVENELDHDGRWADEFDFAVLDREWRQRSGER